MRAIERDGAHYRIGPLTTYADPAELQAWHRRANLGAEMTYAIGPALGTNAATPVIARKLRDSGEATLFLRRQAGGIHYIIRKRAKVAALQVAADEHAVPAGPLRQLYTALCTVAAEGMQMPSLEALAELAGLSDRHAAHYRLGQLSAGGHVRLLTSEGQRIAEIVATGMRTAQPAPAGER